MGLSTVYGIVKQSSGCVLVDSEVGRGSTFRVYLPPVAEEPITRDVAVPVGRLHGNESILLVEDEVELRKLVHSILENHGYAVVQASRSEEALCVLDGDAKIDLLLTDVFMPDVSGVQLAQRARERHRDMKVCYMSGFTEHHVIKTSVLEPGAHFVQKPFTPHALLQKVREALNEPPQARV